MLSKAVFQEVQAMANESWLGRRVKQETNTAPFSCQATMENVGRMPWYPKKRETGRDETDAPSLCCESGGAGCDCGAREGVTGKRNDTFGCMGGLPDTCKDERC